MARLFGTDGVRGLANEALTPELALALGSAAAGVLVADADGRRPVAVVGRDPRASGTMLSAALTAGMSAGGVDVVDVGVLPTPAVAFLTGDLGADFGAMISASHNPMPDNGIKFFARGGAKLDDETENAIEAVLGGPHARPTGAAVGRITAAPDAVGRYLTHLATSTPATLAGLTVVVDCAHGAATAAAPEAYRAAGATVVAINAEPTGDNINDGCGSTHLGAVSAAVRAHGADLGLAHDGDADRCLAVDAAGRLVDGDQIMAVIATAMHDAGELVANTLVATVMSNIGLHQAMRRHGITLKTTGVGDRYVLEELRAGGYNLGGEQSGHIVLTDHATTGDGILTGLRIMARMAETGRSLADLASIMTVSPQRLINVAVKDKSAVAKHPAVLDAVLAAEADLGDSGRVLLRPSGTEQLVRVMVEAATDEDAESVASRLAVVVGSV